MPRRSVSQASCNIKTGFTIILLIVIGACTQETIHVRPKYSGDHTTGQIRGMWQICYQSRVRSQPYLPPPMHMSHCDCLVDKSREKISSGDYTKIGSDNLTKFFAEMSLECDKGMFIPTIPDQT